MLEARALRRALIALSISSAVMAGEVAALDALHPMHLPLTLSEYGTVEVTATIQGTGEATFLVDTGSEYMVISSGTLAQLMEAGTAARAGQIRGRRADGTVVTAPLYRLDAIQIGDCVLNDVHTVVFPGIQRGILGFRVLARMSPFQIDVAGRILTVSECAPA